jgi:serine/threonine-protein kinase
MVRGMAFLCQGNVSGAEEALRRCTVLDPLSAPNCARMAYLCYIKGECEAAAELLQHCFERDRDYPEARLYAGLLHFQKQEYDAVIEQMSRSPVPLEIGLAAAAYARQKSVGRAKDCVGKLARLATTQYVTPLAHAFAAIGMEDYSASLQRLEQAIDDKTNFVNMLAVEPFFDPLRSDARFTNLLKRLNLSN